MLTKVIFCGCKGDCKDSFARMDNQGEIKLTPGGQKRLSNLVEMKDMMMADAIRQRGGGQNQINQLETGYELMLVGEIANLSAVGDAQATTAIKILKQARKKRDKYSGK